MPTIETRELSNAAKDIIEKHTPRELETKFKDGDYLYMMGIAFKMVYYSMAALPCGQSSLVTYWSELYNIEINLDFIKEVVNVETPVIDWRRDGF